MEEELRAILLANSGVQSLVGDRVNFGVHPQGAGWPGLVLTTVSNVEGYSMKCRNGLWEGRVQIDCYALDYGRVTTLARAVIELLSFYKGGGFRAIFHEGMRVGRDNQNTVDRPFRASLDFNTNWRVTNE